MKKLYLFVLIFSFFSCNETLLEKPDNLIPEVKMIAVLKDLAIVNAAKSTNISVLHENNIEPMTYIYEKHDIDSLQFVESDRYYASLPVTYERIYKKVESKLERQAKVIEKAKNAEDSLDRVQRKIAIEKKANKVTDSLP